MNYTLVKNVFSRVFFVVIFSSIAVVINLYHERASSVLWGVAFGILWISGSVVSLVMSLRMANSRDPQTRKIFENVVFWVSAAVGELAVAIFMILRFAWPAAFKTVMRNELMQAIIFVCIMPAMVGCGMFLKKMILGSVRTWKSQ